MSQQIPWVHAVARYVYADKKRADYLSGEKRSYPQRHGLSRYLTAYVHSKTVQNGQ